MCESAESYEASSSSPAAEAEPLRMVLLGRTGTGRSSSGNTILGRSAFWVESSPCSVTTRCQRQSGTVAGRSISIVDTPGFFHTEMSPQEVLSEVGQCVRLYPPGPHVFLVTLQTARFTQQERETLKWIRALFGPELSKFTMVLFTCGDRLMDKPVEDFLQESSELFEFVSSCDGRYHVFENTSHDKKTQEQVQKLLEKVDIIVADNEGRCYNNVMFKRAEGALMEARERILGSEDKKEQVIDSERRRMRREEDEEEEDSRRRAERLFWCELLSAVGKGAVEGAGIVGKDKEGKGKAVRKVKVVEKAAALVASPLSISSAAKVVGGAVREGSKVLYKHKNTWFH